jgi:hypothetical protein
LFPDRIKEDTMSFGGLSEYSDDPKTESILGRSSLTMAQLSVQNAKLETDSAIDYLKKGNLGKTKESLDRIKNYLDRV